MEGPHAKLLELLAAFQKKMSMGVELSHYCYRKAA